MVPALAQIHNQTSQPVRVVVHVHKLDVAYRMIVPYSVHSDSIIRNRLIFQRVRANISLNIQTGSHHLFFLFVFTGKGRCCVTVMIRTVVMDPAQSTAPDCAFLSFFSSTEYSAVQLILCTKWRDQRKSTRLLLESVPVTRIYSASHQPEEH